MLCDLSTLLAAIYLTLTLFCNNRFKAEAQYRIVGGTDVADHEDIPYQVSLQILTSRGSYQHFCGGSILSPSHVLTAAHCVSDVHASRLSVVAGIKDLNATGQRANVMRYDIYPGYEELVTGDIAILYISPKLLLDGRRVDKITIQNDLVIGDSTLLMLTGWGSVDEVLSIYPIRLQKLIYKSISYSECKQTMANLTHGEMCARGLNEGSCVGDSGGPLVMRRSNVYIQVGIVSYGSTTCANMMPDVYTRISAFAGWILEKIF